MPFDNQSVLPPWVGPWAQSTEGQPGLFLIHAEKWSDEAGGQDTVLEMKKKEALSTMLKVAASALRSCGVLVRGFYTGLGTYYIF